MKNPPGGDRGGMVARAVPGVLTTSRPGVPRDLGRLGPCADRDRIDPLRPPLNPVRGIHRGHERGATSAL